MYVVVNECRSMPNTQCLTRRRGGAEFFCIFNFSRTGHAEGTEATQRHSMTMVVESRGFSFSIFNFQLYVGDVFERLGNAPVMVNDENRDRSVFHQGAYHVVPHYHRHDFGWAVEQLHP